MHAQSRALRAAVFVSVRWSSFRLVAAWVVCCWFTRARDWLLVDPPSGVGWWSFDALIAWVIG
eukprot:7394403-Pyramimonas_sp.AAC.1